MDAAQSSVLTQSQRELLRENKNEISEAGERMAKKRIRERLHKSIFDYALLQSKLELDEIRQAFTDTSPPATEPKELNNIHNQLHKAIALLYLGSSEAREVDTDNEAFAGAVENGIRRAYNKCGVSLENITVTIDVEEGPELEDLPGREDDLTYTQAKELLEGGEIGADEFLRLGAKALGGDGDDLSGQPYDDAKSRAKWLAVLEGVDPDDLED